jgi:hypothetical protein
MKALIDLVRERFPGAAVVSVDRLGDDERASDATMKGTGFGVPIRVVLRERDGRERALVLHTARADDFGHDRRADRAAAMLLAYDTYGSVPNHVSAVDVGVIARDGALRSIADATEVYLLTEWVPGELYASDLRRIAVEGAHARDLHRADALTDYLTALHIRHQGRLAVYTRAVRDLVGSGEGIYGMIDGYDDDVPAAPPRRLARIEQRAAEWRWRLCGRETRVARIHGDFHPFNILFTGERELTLLDASRGAAGEPADDVTALAINFVFFAIDTPGAWERGLSNLWHRVWSRYMNATSDHEILEVAAPWLAWRALVVCNPRWYPNLSAEGRDRILAWVERALEARRFDPRSADEVVS